MTDLLLDKEFRPQFNSTGELKTVEDEKEAEQSIRIGLTDNMYSILSRYNENEAKKKIRLEVTRVAKESPFIDSVESISVSKNVIEDSLSFDVSINYNKGERYSQTIQQI